MFGTVAVTPRTLAEYAPILDELETERIRRAAAPLAGLRVLNLSMLGSGTALTDLLAVQTPLLQDLGVKATWQTLRTSEQFTGVNRAMYAALGGRPTEWSEHARETWRGFIAMNAQLFDEPYDVVVVHDPQAAPVIDGGRAALPGARWVWHCHLDLSGTRPEVWAELVDAVARYDAVVFDHEGFLPPGFTHAALRFIPPGIDPTGPRSMPLTAEAARDLLRRYGIVPDRPLVAQIGPLDQESNALGAITVYDALRERVPGLQLLLVATHLTEDAETRAYYERCCAAVAERPAVTLLLADVHEIGNIELSVFQRQSQVVLHPSLRRGFGLWVAEAMWQERPVVAGRHGGLPLLIEDGISGYLVEHTDQAVARTGELLADPTRAASMGRAARERIRNHFLVTRVVQDYLDLLATVTAAGVPV